MAPVAVRAVAVSLILAATQGACGGGSPTTPPTTTTTTTSTTTSTTSTTTPTTSTTSTTTTSTTSTTTTTTTTTMRITYALVHPIWSSRGCTGCHTSGNRLNLSGGATATCGIVSNGQDGGGGQYLDNPACSDNGSSILRVPNTGTRPNGTPHPGAMESCFSPGGACRRDILAWCNAGADCL